LAGLATIDLYPGTGLLSITAARLGAAPGTI
jgi:predicted RNA methylase